MISDLRLYTLKEVASIFLCSTTTVKRWVREGLLVPRYQILSGRCYRLVFPEAELNRFMDKNFPSPEDLDSTHESRSSRQRAETVRRLVNMHRLYLGRATAARMARECGVHGENSEKQEELKTEEEPVIVNHRPRRRQNEAEGQDERNLGGNRDNEEEEED